MTCVVATGGPEQGPGGGGGRHGGKRHALASARSPSSDAHTGRTQLRAPESNVGGVCILGIQKFQRDSSVCGFCV